MTSRATIMYGLGIAAIIVAGPRILAQVPAIPPSVAEPGPLDGGEQGQRYRGPGFGFYLPNHWTTALDEIPQGHGVRGERGTAYGSLYKGDPDTDASIRFEPFPLEPGQKGTLQQFEAHIRATLAVGVPVGVLPLIPRGTLGALIPCGDEPEGIVLLFTRPGTDGTENAQRRYSVCAYPRLDGRLQTLIFSHLGKPTDGFSGAFPAMAEEELAAIWPDTGSVFRREDLGVLLPLPPGWRQGSFYPECGNGIPTAEEGRYLFMPTAVFTVVDPAARIPGYECLPRVELHVVQEMNRSLGSVMSSFGEAGANAQEFKFADGNVGGISESEHFLTILRREGRRFARLQVLNPRPQDRERMLALAAGLSMVEPARPEKPSDHPKAYTSHGVTMSYPGDWKLTADSLRTIATRHRLAGGFEPFATPADRAAKRAAQMMPKLRFEVVRLDELLASYRGSARHQRANESVSADDQAFTTDSGWAGRRWIYTFKGETRRGPWCSRSTQYILPMPDGVTALVFAGSTTINDGNKGSAEAIEEIWRGIAASVRIVVPPQTPRADGQQVFQ